MPTIFIGCKYTTFFFLPWFFVMYLYQNLLFLPIMDTTRQQFIAINKQIFNQRDGEVREMQQEYGAVYKRSLGVPVVSLQNIAVAYEPSHELAKLFWEFGGREQTLIAAMLEEPEKVEKRKLEEHLLQTSTPELWEQITRQLLRRLPKIKDWAKSWLEREEEELHIFAILSLGYLPDLYSEELLQQLMQIFVKEGSYLEKCLHRVLLKVGIRDRAAYEQLKRHLKMRSRYKDLLVEIADFYA